MTCWIIHLSGKTWHESINRNDRFWLNGQAYLDDQVITIDQLNSHLDSIQDSNQLMQAQQRLNGFYAWVSVSDQLLRAGVDHIRSRPLYYSHFNEYLYLSDDAEWVRQQVGDREMDPVAKEEFQLVGYVTGADTLFPNVKQLQAGECLMAMRDDNCIRVDTHRFYRFMHTEPDCYDKPSLRDELDHIVIASIQRLIDYANCRQIVVPLSGGYDSRLIVTLLKRLGCQNILTFTYGVLGNKESEYSKRVADVLGLRWHFIEYSEALWREAWQTQERWDYQKWASGLNSIAHVQDWLAVQKLKDGMIVDNDAIFVPGHSGDFVAGSHIPDEAFNRNLFTLADINNAIVAKHYSLAPIKLFSKSSGEWCARVQCRVERNNCQSSWEFADGIEKWDWQERQAKFIGNSVRVYEFYGYDWWMPLWDKEFVRFWQRVPLGLRRGREFYLGYVKDQYGTHAIKNSQKELKNASEGLKYLSLLRKARALKYLARWTCNVINQSSLYPLKHILCQKKGPSNLAWKGRYNDDVLKELLFRGYNINGINAYHFLDRMSVDVK